MPLNDFIYFAMVIGFTMFLNHPVFLIISLLGGFCYTLQLFGWKRCRKGLAGLFVLMLLTALINPAFSHQGITVLACLPTGNVLTLESILFGIGAGCKLGAVMLWFRCAGEILTTDKIIYLFGKTFPVLGLLLSMILGFLPKMQKKLHEIIMARGHIKNIRQAMENLSTLITWALEDAAKQADSMKARGYGLEGRTVFTTFRFTRRDRRLCMVFLLEIVLMTAGILCGITRWDYYPEISEIAVNGWSISLYALYCCVCLTPLVTFEFYNPSGKRDRTRMI